MCDVDMGQGHAGACPFGIVADHMDRRLQLGIGAAVLVSADIVLAVAPVTWMSVAGAALWGLQMAVTQGPLLASVGDAAPGELRGTAFGSTTWRLASRPSSQALLPERYGWRVAQNWHSASVF